MPSYKLIPTPQDELDTENPGQKIEKLSARDSKQEYRRGTIPESLAGLSDENIFWFNYAIEREFEYETLEGEHTTKILEKHPVIFLDSDFVAIGSCKQEVEEEIIEFIETHFISGYSLETLELREGSLRQIIENAPDIIKADFNPTDRSEPEQISGKDRRSLKATDFWQRHEGEPVSKVKVHLPGEDKEIRVGFDKYGTIILYEQKLKMKEQVEALNYIAENVVTKFVNPGYQSTLGRGE